MKTHVIIKNVRNQAKTTWNAIILKIQVDKVVQIGYQVTKCISQLTALNNIFAPVPKRVFIKQLKLREIPLV